MNCQLMNRHELLMENSLWEDIGQMRIRILWDTKKKLLMLKNKSMKALGIRGPVKLIMESAPVMQAGDLVKVKSAEEIRSLLDENGGSQGCIFTPEMYAYCGKQARLFKKVGYFYDEVKNKMCKCKNLFLLEGAFCSGKRRAFPNACDRNCFLFWHSSWLEKVNDGDGTKN
jgi:hypothetical protein